MCTPRGRRRISGGRQQHVRDFSRAFARGGIRWMYWFVLPFSLILSAEALPPLVSAADIAQPNVVAFHRHGEFWVGAPNQPGRPGLRPLDDLQPRTLPSNLDDYSLLGNTCTNPPTDNALFGGLPVTATVSGDTLHPVIRLHQEGRPIAQSLLGRPAAVCSLHLIEADSVPGPELVVVWDLPTVRGYTVYRVPEALDPTEADGQ